MKYIVYETTNLVNNKIYVGVHQTENPDVFDGYIGNGIFINQAHTYENPTRAFQFAVKKYGTKNFRRKTLAVFDNENDAYKLEEQIVTKEFILRKDVYNVKVGGSGGASYYVKVYQFDLKGNLVKEWVNMVECARFFGVSDTAIRNKLVYKKSLNNFYFSTNNSINISEYSITKISTPCYKYLDNGKFVEEYDSISDCCKQNNLHSEKLKNIIANGNLTDGYYYSFKLSEEYIPPKPLKDSVIYIYDKEGNYITETRNELERKKFINTKAMAKINTAISYGRLYKGEYQFSREKVDKMPKYVNCKEKKKVAQYTMEGELIRVFESQKEATDIYGNGVRKVIKGQQKHCHNFIFRQIS